jgi:uncharacterized membrane protein
VRHHWRFYAALVLGIMAWWLSVTPRQALRLAVSGDTFFFVYLALTAAHVWRVTPADIRRHASYEDEGRPVIVVLTLTSVSLSFAALFAMISGMERGDPLLLGLTVLSVLLSWLTLHTVASFHYAHLYYARAEGEGRRKEAGGLEFKETKEPTMWEFFYYSFTVGMTAQTSDVDVVSTQMRKLTLFHSVVSFFFNTVLLALAVNLAASYAR